ncbi:hemerythrin domain-containing protein [Salicibibacter cibarius]|uniref:Hemerythrin domain-containing protein n=1 Tax=Salicibibacter cibarius TaxID=2743000 RepID=A0A7T6Z1K9_9BACI|nr:hemerythrin domain-containing protein [Salicibibacter cibarius]QQK75313.1 hemerythrin domain-containing protein [Salicibibacter cibarius]
MGSGGNEHFRDEEELLLPAYSLDEPEISEMLVEHVHIRALVQQVLETTDGGGEAMHHLGTMLKQHICKEERVIFPMMEKVLPEDVLERLHPRFHQVDPSQKVFSSILSNSRRTYHPKK